MLALCQTRRRRGPDGHQIRRVRAAVFTEPAGEQPTRGHVGWGTGVVQQGKHGVSDR